MAERRGNGVFHQVQPMLVRKKAALAQVLNELNALKIEADPVGSIFLQGPGAGGGATASAVLADIADITQGFGRPLFATRTADMTESAVSTGAPSEFYIRLALADKPGSMARASSSVKTRLIFLDAIVSLLTYLPQIQAMPDWHYKCLLRHSAPRGRRSWLLHRSGG